MEQRAPGGPSPRGFAGTASSSVNSVFSAMSSSNKVNQGTAVDTLSQVTRSVTRSNSDALNPSKYIIATLGQLSSVGHSAT